MPGIKALRKLQFGREGTAGTAVAASTIWRGLGTLEDQREVVFNDEDVGIVPGTDRTHIPKLFAQLELEDTALTFEQGPHLCEMGIKAATATADGLGSGYIYEYPFGVTSVNTLKHYTIEGGDNQQAEEMEFCYASEISLTGKAGEALMIAATIGGRQVTNTTFTADLSLPAVEDVLFSKGKLYIDAASDTIGTTQKTQTLLSMDSKISTGIMPVWTADGQLYFTFVKGVRPEIVTELVFEHDATSVALKTDFRDQTARLIRLEWLGSALADAGTAHTYKTFRFDQAAKIEKVAKIGDQDGNDVISMTFRARYNSTAALFAQLLFVNELSALP